MIPFIIFNSVFFAFKNMLKGAFVFATLLIVSIIFSNALSVSIAGSVSYLYSSINHQLYGSISQNPDDLIPLVDFHIPRPVTNNIALLLGFVLGMVASIRSMPAITNSANFIKNYSDFFLQKLFLPMLPIFVFGFIIKLIHDNVLEKIISYNSTGVLIMLATLFGYLFTLYTFAVLITKKPFFFFGKNIISPGITAFTTMSSAAALPFSLKATELNLKNKEIGNAVMPVSVNIHMIGDSICSPMLSLILLSAFNMPLPSFDQYLVFIFFFVITKFSGAGVPGGSILVMIPILEKYMGFNVEMIGIITVFYMLIDPLTSLGNVLGNNIFVILFEQIYNKVKKLT